MNRMQMVRVGFLAIAFSCGPIAGLTAAAPARQESTSQHAYLGVELRDATGRQTPRGAVVLSVKDRSPAAAAGLKPGDIVTAASGQRIVSAAQFLKLITGKRPGAVIKVRVLRRGALREGPVKLGAPPEQVTVAAAQPGPVTQQEPVTSGATPDQPTPPATAGAVSGARPSTASSKQAAPKEGAEAAAPQQTALLDPAKIDPLEIDPSRIDPGKLDAKSPNTWIALGRLEMRGGNLGGGQASFERAIALSGPNGDKAAAGAAMLGAGTLHSGLLSFMRVEAGNVARFGGSPSEQLTKSINDKFEKAKASYEDALTLFKALDRKDGMAAAHTRLGDLYMTGNNFDQAQAMYTESLNLNKALQRKKEMAANYRALAETHRYDLDQAEALLKEAAALHEAPDLKEELATDYQKLADINMKRGEPQEAERFYKQALALAAKGSQISILHALEQLYRDRNDPGQAAEVKEQAAALEKERQKNGGGAKLMVDWGIGLYLSGVATKGQMEALEMAVPMEQSIGHQSGLGLSYLLLGLHYAQRAELDEEKRAEFEEKAEGMFRNAVTLNASLGQTKALAQAYNALAELLGRRGKSEQLQAVIKDARSLYEKLGDRDGMAKLYLTLGYNKSRSGDNAQACAYWRQGAEAHPGHEGLVSAMKYQGCGAKP